MNTAKYPIGRKCVWHDKHQWCSKSKTWGVTIEGTIEGYSGELVLVHKTRALNGVLVGTAGGWKKLNDVTIL